VVRPSLLPKNTFLYKLCLFSILRNINTFQKSVASKPIRIRKHPIFNLRLKESELKSNTEAISLRALYWLSPTSCMRSIGPLPSPLSLAEVDKKQKFHWKDLIRDGPSFFWRGRWWVSNFLGPEGCGWIFLRAIPGARISLKRNTGPGYFFVSHGSPYTIFFQPCFLFSCYWAWHECRRRITFDFAPVLTSYSGFPYRTFRTSAEERTLGTWILRQTLIRRRSSFNSNCFFFFAVGRRLGRVLWLHLPRRWSKHAQLQTPPNGSKLEETKSTRMNVSATSSPSFAYSTNNTSCVQK